MKILVTNDDGIKAQGIRELTKALSEVGEVYVIAPETQKSAAGHAISIHSILKVIPSEIEGAKKAYAITGSPADCTKLGLHILKDQGIEIDIVFSGINHGGNMGTDTLYSGTVSAAIEANLCGKPAVAVSVNDHYPIGFEYAASLAAMAAENLKNQIEKARKENKEFEHQTTTFSINVPNLPKEQIKGIRHAILGPREYDGWFTKLELEDIPAERKRPDLEKLAEGEMVYKYSGTPVSYKDLPNDMDVLLVEEGYATITPLKYDLTNMSKMAGLSEILEEANFVI